LDLKTDFQAPERKFNSSKHDTLNSFLEMDLDPDTDSEFRSVGPTESGSNPKFSSTTIIVNNCVKTPKVGDYELFIE
jgi:hypothetical protein